MYVLGNAEILRRKIIAIVGSRECTSYGKKAAETIAYNLSKQDIVIISGLAKGIDAYAHIGALKAKGKTIAVMAHGLDMIYPRENREIAKEIIINGGAIISEYPIGVRPKPEQFVKRNRIISGMSQGVIIVEAKERSGALITANYAIEQGKNLYAVPGSIFSDNSNGTNKLISKGAEIVTGDFNINNLNLF